MFGGGNSWAGILFGTNGDKTADVTSAVTQTDTQTDTSTDTLTTAHDNTQQLASCEQSKLQNAPPMSDLPTLKTAYYCMFCCMSGVLFNGKGDRLCISCGYSGHFCIGSRATRIVPKFHTLCECSMTPWKQMTLTQSETSRWKAPPPSQLRIQN